MHVPYGKDADAPTIFPKPAIWCHASCYRDHGLLNTKIDMKKDKIIFEGQSNRINDPINGQSNCLGASNLERDKVYVKNEIGIINDFGVEKGYPPNCFV